MISLPTRRALLPAGCAFLAGTATMALLFSATAQESSPTDPRVAAVLESQARLGKAMEAKDIPAIEALMAPDLLVHSPINKVVNRDNVIARIRAGQISYEPGVSRHIDFAGLRDNIVVVMGEETVQPNQNAPHAGKTVHRRFTDLWKQTGGSWKLWIRQATITQAE